MNLSGKIINLDRDRVHEGDYMYNELISPLEGLPHPTSPSRPIYGKHRRGSPRFMSNDSVYKRSSDACGIRLISSPRSNSMEETSAVTTLGINIETSRVEE